MRWLGSLLVAFVIAGCVGAIGDGSESTSGPAGGPDPVAGTKAKPFTCDPAAVPATVPLRRLSRVQVRNTLRDLLNELGQPGVFGVVAPKLDKLPDDRPTTPDGETHGGFRRLDQIVNQEHVTVGYDVAVATGRALPVQSIAGACATDADASNDDACLESFVRKVGELALRRPLETEDVAFYKGVAGGEKVTAAALSDVVAAMLASPRFLYHVEHGTDDATWSALDAWELAARLSYHFWQTMPDAKLREAARSGALLTDAGFSAEVHRLFADPRTEQTLDAFFREWLWLDELGRLDARLGDPVFDAFVGEDRPTPELRDRMIEDVLAAARAATRGGTFADFFFDAKPYAKTKDLLAIYGGGEGRAGLITRPAFLATGSANTRPIMKGVFIRKALLCDEIPPPPNNAAANAPKLSPTMTTREVVEQLTQKPGTACASCHATVINPLGFATENFDALGRHRTAQRLFDESGKLLGEKKVDTTSVPRVVPEDMRPSSGAKDVAQYLLESGKVQACFARQWFRFTFSRGEDDARDGCLLEDVAKGASEGKSLAEVLMRVALRPEFKRRSF